MYSLQLSMSAKISFNALSSSRFSKCVKIFFIVGKLFIGVVFSNPYFSAKVETLEIRFPSLFASSSLFLFVKISSE